MDARVSGLFWKGKVMTKNCKTCAFWQFFDCAQEDESEDDDVDLGFCCRHPPIFIGVQPDARPYSPHNWEQPVTTNRDWCGDWALRTKTPALTGDESRPAQQAAGPTYTITQT